MIYELENEDFLTKSARTTSNIYFPKLVINYIIQLIEKNSESACKSSKYMVVIVIALTIYKKHL